MGTEGNFSVCIFLYHLGFDPYDAITYSEK